MWQESGANKLKMIKNDLPWIKSFQNNRSEEVVLTGFCLGRTKHNTLSINQ